MDTQLAFALDRITGATRQITLCMPELTENGHLANRDHTLNVCISRRRADGDGTGASPRQASSASVAQRLQHDLGINLAGAALALDLLERIEQLESVLGKIDADRSVRRPDTNQQ